MTGRQWPVGEPFEAEGAWFRVVPGRKGPSDLRLDWYATDEFGAADWRPVPMAACLLMADFFYDNEERLFPPPAGHGGGLWSRVLLGAMRDGWRPAAERLKAERAARRARDAVVVEKGVPF